MVCAEAAASRGTAYHMLGLGLTGDDAACPVARALEAHEAGDARKLEAQVVADGIAVPCSTMTQQCGNAR